MAEEAGRQEIHGWTALRGVAAMWIVVYHFAPHFGDRLAFWWVDKGYMAVDLFFVLSGAVMYHVYARSIAEQRFSWADFMWKRVARLYPVHLVTMIGAVIILYGGAALGLGPAPGYNPWFASAMNVLVLHGLGVLDDLTLNYPSWSISAELVAYLFFYPLGLFMLRFKPRAALLLSVLVLLGTFLVAGQIRTALWPSPEHGQVLTHVSFQAAYMRVIPEFLLGMAVSRVGQGVRQLSRAETHGGLCMLLLLGLAALYLHLDWAFTLIGAALVGLLLVGELHPPRWSLYLGTISYSIYMVHALIEMVVFKGFEIAFGFPANGIPTVLLVVPVVLVVLAGYALHILIEEPYRKRLTRRRAAPAGFDGGARRLPSVPDPSLPRTQMPRRPF